MNQASNALDYSSVNSSRPWRQLSVKSHLPTNTRYEVGRIVVSIDLNEGLAGAKELR